MTIALAYICQAKLDRAAHAPENAASPASRVPELDLEPAKVAVD
jgi:hypothetical protein